MAEDENLRKKPSSSLGGTSIEPYIEKEKKYFPKGKPPAYPYEEENKEKQKVILKPKPNPEISKPQISSRSNTQITPNILSLIAIILSLIAIFLVLTSQGIDKNELKGIASDLRALNNKELSINVPIESELYFNNAIPSNQLFKGKQIIPVYFEIPITQTMKGKDIRTGIPLEVEITDKVIVKGNISIDLTNSNISLQLNEPAKAFGNTTSVITVKDVYGYEISSIAERIDKLSK